MAKDTGPVCNLYPPCKASDDGRCVALQNNDFGGKVCPFYKARKAKDPEPEKPKKKQITFTDAW